MMYKLLFTGGHHNSALAIVKWLSINEKNIKIEWVGDQIPSDCVVYPEYKEVSDLNIPYHRIIAGKIFRFSNPIYLPKAILSFLKIPIGFFQAFYLLLTNRPDLIVSFGGFIAVPVVVSGKLLGIKSVTHEQTVVLGFANSIIARFVDSIYVSWPISLYSAKDSIKNKMVYAGLPIDIDGLRTVERFGFKNNLRTIYVTGGKKGSLTINECILSNLEFLVSNFNIIWSCGDTKGKFDFENISFAIDKLEEKLKSRILLKEYFFKSEISTVFNTCDFVISRSGAHTVYELAILEKPCILIPIPWSSNDEQKKNAELLVKVGLGEIIEESELLKQDFRDKVVDFSDKLEKRKNGVRLDELGDIVTEKGQENLGNEIVKILKAES